MIIWNGVGFLNDAVTEKHSVLDTLSQITISVNYNEI